MDSELKSILIDIQKEYVKSDIIKNRIIILLIILMFVEAIVGYVGFVWYESQFDVVEERTVDISTDGDNASAIYNDVSGNQYNDSAVHNEGLGGTE